jgi:hypothetical protein
MYHPAALTLVAAGSRTLALGWTAYRTWRPARRTLPLLVHPFVLTITGHDGAVRSLAVLITSFGDDSLRIERVAIVTLDAKGVPHTIELGLFQNSLPRALRRGISEEFRLDSGVAMEHAADRFDHAFAITSSGDVVLSNGDCPFKGQPLGALLQRPALSLVR